MSKLLTSLIGYLMTQVVSKIERRHTRYLARIPIQVKTKHRTFTAVTCNVSLSGLWVEWGQLPRDLPRRVSVQMVLPDRLDTLIMQARTVRHAAEHKPSGIALEFIPQQRDLFVRWGDFIAKVGASYHRTPTLPSPHQRLSIVYPDQSLGGLYQLQQMDIFMGGMFVPCEVMVPPGLIIDLIINHPVDASRHALPIKVVRRTPCSPSGLYVRFMGDLGEVSRRFGRFIQRGLPDVNFEEFVITTREPLRHTERFCRIPRTDVMYAPLFESGEQQEVA